MLNSEEVFAVDATPSCYMEGEALIMKLLPVALFVPIFLLSGCAELQQKIQDPLYRNYSVSPLTVSPQADSLVLINALLNLKVGDSPLLSAKCFASIVPAADVAECTAQRNTTISVLIIGSEQLCLEHRRTIYGNDAAANIVLGSFTNLFAGAASVISNQATQSLLAALALFSNSERSLVNETVYKTMIVSAVDKKIQEIREVKAQAIYTGMTTNINSYPVVVAIKDVTVFHNSCSFMTGLQKALEEGTQGSNAQKILRLREALRNVENEIQRSCPTTRPPATPAAPAAAPAAPAAAPAAPAAAPAAPAAPVAAPAAPATPATNCARLEERAKAISESLQRAEAESPI